MAAKAVKVAKAFIYIDTARKALKPFWLNAQYSEVSKMLWYALFRVPRGRSTTSPRNEVFSLQNLEKS